jgi:hypothetical protein
VNRHVVKLVIINHVILDPILARNGNVSMTAAVVLYISKTSRFGCSVHDTLTVLTEVAKQKATRQPRS